MGSRTTATSLAQSLPHACATGSAHGLRAAGVTTSPVVRHDIEDAEHFLARVHAQLTVRAHQLGMAAPARPRTCALDAAKGGPS